MTIEDVEDHVRKYTAAEDEQLARQLRTITEECHRGQLWPISLQLLRDIHRRLFDGVRDHAGRPRAYAFGDEHLTFGPNRSVHRDQVEPQLQDVFNKLDRSISSFLAHPDDPAYERSAVHVAVWAHAEVVRIHPFLDGNGRSSRLLMNAVLVGLGLEPIAVEAVKQEYNEALNHYFRTKELNLLVDLMLQLVD
jgi:fido (protein-threonine AMPylation protein)